jgi:hypothetical protein
MSPPPPLALGPVILLSMIGIVCVFQAIMSHSPFEWGVVAGAFFLVAGYMVGKSFVPVKKYRDPSVPSAETPTATPPTAGEGI